MIRTVGQWDEKKKIRLVFWALVAIGVLTRVWRLGSIPWGVNQDEAMGAVDAWALANYGTDRYGTWMPVHFAAWQVSQMSVLLAYCMTPFLKLFGFHTAVIRVPLALASCGSMVLMYFVGKRLFSEKTGLLMLALTVINPWHFMQSRWALDCNLFPHVFLLAFYLLLLGLEKRRYLYLSMLFFGLTFYCYGVAVYSVTPFLAVFAFWCLWKKQLRWREVLVCALLFGLVALPEILVMAINLFGGSTIETPFFTMSRFPYSVRGNDILFLNFSVEQLGKNLWAMISHVFLQLPDLLFNALPAFGPLYHVSIPFILIGIVLFTKALFRERDIREQTRKLALWGFLVMGIWVGIITYEVNINRINIIFFPLIALCAIGIQRAAGLRSGKPGGLIAAAYGVCFVLFLAAYFTDYAEASQVYYNKSFLETVKKADSMEDYDRLYITGNLGWQFNQSAGEILTHYACGIDARYYQEKTNENGGRELLPYRERYHFIYPAQMDDRAKEEAAEGLVMLHESELEYMNFEYEILAGEGQYVLLTGVK